MQAAKREHFVKQITIRLMLRNASWIPIIQEYIYSDFMIFVRMTRYFPFA